MKKEKELTLFKLKTTIRKQKKKKKNTFPGKVTSHLINKETNPRV